MSSRARKDHIDRSLLFLLVVLVAGGGAIFASAAFGMLARGTAGIPSIVFNHLVLGLGAGFIALLITAFVDYHSWRRYALPFFIGACILTALVFIPGIGLSHGGGRRWILLWHFSLQPSEVLKLATLLFAASYFSSLKSHINTLRYGVGGLCAILVVPAIILIAQPDIGTLGVISIAVFSVFFAAGARIRYITLLGVVAIALFAGLIMMKGYVQDRIETFLHPSANSQGAGYQIRQSLIAIGSGGAMGRGWGQGIQKFSYLPEPMGDSIFAVAGEEFGFVGTTIIVCLFLALALRGFVVGTNARDSFGGLLAIGISTYLVVEAFINMASMLGVAPLTGIPLTFVSQGGSAILVSLASAGILLNISRHAKRV